MLGDSFRYRVGCGLVTSGLSVLLPAASLHVCSLYGLLVFPPQSKTSHIQEIISKLPLVCDRSGLAEVASHAELSLYCTCASQEIFLT